MSTIPAGKAPPPPSLRTGKAWMTPEEVAAEFKVSVALLARWRCDTPGGPPWYRYGPRTPRYIRDEVEQWALALRVDGPRADVGDEPEEQPA